MCGIVGIITKNKNGFIMKDIQIFEQLLFVGQLRGHHGTGIFFNGKKDKIRTIKGALPASEFLESETYLKAVNPIFQDSSFIIGHNRWATKGAPNYKNTHPFTEGDITLIHNGTLDFHKNMADVEVDSHAICHSINSIGTENTLEKISGAFALVWHDKRNNTLNIIRNTERPLYIIETKEFFVVVSELMMAKWILSRNNIPIIDENKITQLTPGTLYITHLDTLEKEEKEMKIKEKFIYKNFSYEEYYPTALEVKAPITISQPHPAVTVSSAPLIGTNTFYGKARGDMIQFVPEKIAVGQASDYLIGTFETEYCKIKTEVQVRFYNHNSKLLDYLMSRKNLVSKITNIVSEAGIGKVFIVDIPYSGVISENGKVLSQTVISSLDTTCHCCGGVFSHDELQLKQSSIIENSRTHQLDVYCPACTEWADTLTEQTVGVC